MAESKQSSGDVAYANTDRELWRDLEGNAAPEAGDYYAPSIHVTEQGAIGISVGGTVYVKTLREWHAIAEAVPTFQGRPILHEPTAILTERVLEDQVDELRSERDFLREMLQMALASSQDRSQS